MTVLITLTLAGSDANLFDLYSDLDGYITPFETDVNKTSLTSGYSSILVPDYTTIIRIQSKGSCVNYVDVVLENLPILEIPCNEELNSGTSGVTEYLYNLESDGGLVILEFNGQGVPDKLEILHNNIKKATSGMTVPNEGPFDDLYGSPNVPTNIDVNTVDQFIGDTKDSIPSRQTEFSTETGSSITIESGYQQLIWWQYNSDDYNINPEVIIRITGPSGTGWDLKRLCEEITTTTTTSTTTTIFNCIEYTAQTYSPISQQIIYVDCYGNSQEIYIGGTSGLDSETFCAIEGSVTYSSEVFVSIIGTCGFTTTTTTITTSPSPLFYDLNISNSTAISNCSGAEVTTYPIAVYSDVISIIIGTILYNDSLLTSPFIGDNTWYNVSSTKSYRINNTGTVIEIDDCSPI